MLIDCLRTHTSITDSECHQMILDTTDRRDLSICQACEYGITLARLCPYHARWAQMTAQKIFRELLEHVYRTYSSFKTHSFMFLSNVASTKFSCDCTPQDLLGCAVAEGLTVITRNRKMMLVVDAKCTDFISKGNA